MKKHITDAKTGIDYTLHGDYYLPDLSLPAEEEIPIGVWGRGCPVGAVDKTVFLARSTRKKSQKQRKMEEVIAVQRGLYKPLQV